MRSQLQLAEGLVDVPSGQTEIQGETDAGSRVEYLVASEYRQAESLINTPDPEAHAGFVHLHVPDLPVAVFLIAIAERTDVIALYRLLKAIGFPVIDAEAVFQIPVDPRLLGSDVVQSQKVHDVSRRDRGHDRIVRSDDIDQIIHLSEVGNAHFHDGNFVPVFN